MRLTLLLLCLTAGCGGAIRSTPAPSSVSEIAGCYSLEYGAWRPEIDNSLLPSPTELPTAIHLRAEPSAWRAGRRGRRLGYEARALPGESPHGRLQVWTPWGSDSVWVGHPIGASGFSLHLERRGADLKGEVKASTDDLTGPGPPETRTSATARRIPCPAS